MSGRNGGDPAFPLQTAGAIYYGISIRDWFAGQALAGMCANRAWDDISWDTTTQQAYEAADAMLAGRAKGGVR